MWLAEQLREKEFTVAEIHGELDQQNRERIIKEFKRGESRILISTDLVSRGIDVHGVS
jgi:superfamily II DNA/RNA helicase